MDTPPRKHPSETIEPFGSEGVIEASSVILPPWDMYTVAVSLISGYILIPLLVTQILMLVNPFLSDTAQLFIQQAITLATWVSIFIFLGWKYGAIWPYLGLKFSRPTPYYVWETVKLILLTTALTLALSLLWMLVEKSIPGLKLEEKLPYANLSSAELVVLAFFAVFMAPMLEELIFRGLVQSTFHKVYSPTGSVLLTTAVFLLLHGSYFGDIKALSHVLVLGLCFGIWRERTQSLVPGMVAHWFNNGLASLLLLMSAK